MRNFQQYDAPSLLCPRSRRLENDRATKHEISKLPACRHREETMVVVRRIEDAGPIMPQRKKSMVSSRYDLPPARPSRKESGEIISTTSRQRRPRWNILRPREQTDVVVANCRQPVRRTNIHDADADDRIRVPSMIVCHPGLEASQEEVSELFTTGSEDF